MTKIFKRLVFLFCSKARIILFRILSSHTPVGPLHRVQAVQVMGAGSITALGPVFVGYFPSPYFFSTYGYLEARGKHARIEIGSNTKINNGFVAIAEKTLIKIGKNCLIGTCVEIYDSDFHALTAEARSKEDKHHASAVLVGDNVFIGSNVRILQGVTIGDGCVIGSNSLVTTDLPPNSIAGGVPAKIIRSLE